MTIGIFDSGLGGLMIAHAVQKALPQYDYIYLGDTLHVPYGGRSGEAIYQYTQRAVDYLFAQGAELIIIACNTASASALRPLQQKYLPAHQPAHRRILGVVVPTVEIAASLHHRTLGLIGTSHLVQSRVYDEELAKLNTHIRLISCATPLLVPLIEHQGQKWSAPILQDYLAPLLAQKIEALMLGCTHYPFLKQEIRAQLPLDTDLISQDDIIPAKLADYLQRHPQLEQRISRAGQRRFCVTDITSGYQTTAQLLYGQAIPLEHVRL